MEKCLIGSYQECVLSFVDYRIYDDFVHLKILKIEKTVMIIF